MGWLVALTEFVGGTLLAIGLLTRPAALAVFIFMMVAAFSTHLPNLNHPLIFENLNDFRQIALSSEVA